MNSPDTFHAHEIVGDIIERFPNTRAVFAKHGLDSCCGARRTLQEALDASGGSLRSLQVDLSESTSGKV